MKWYAMPIFHEQMFCSDYRTAPNGILGGKSHALRPALVQVPPLFKKKKGINTTHLGQTMEQSAVF